jgi:hypothetical protein
MGAQSRRPSNKAFAMRGPRETPSAPQSAGGRTSASPRAVAWPAAREPETDPDRSWPWIISQGEIDELLRKFGKALDETADALARS